MSEMVMKGRLHTFWFGIFCAFMCACLMLYQTFIPRQVYYISTSDKYLHRYIKYSWNNFSIKKHGHSPQTDLVLPPLLGNAEVVALPREGHHRVERHPRPRQQAAQEVVPFFTQEEQLGVDKVSHLGAQEGEGDKGRVLSSSTGENTPP